jgi:hypothetical protein
MILQTKKLNTRKTANVFNNCNCFKTYFDSLCILYSLWSILDLKFSQWWLWKFLSPGIQHRVVRRNISPLSSDSKSKPNKKQEWMRHIWYCTGMAVLVEDNGLSHSISQAFIPDYTVGITIASLQTHTWTVELSTSFLLGGLRITLCLPSLEASE